MMAKEFTIRQVRNTYGREARVKDITMTLPELIQYFSYTLEKGYSWQWEKGNKKINKNPKTAKALVTNLNNAESNAAANGCPNVWYELV